jgi:tetratricopeptide (TPR) repeat protein
MSFLNHDHAPIVYMPSIAPIHVSGIEFSYLNLVGKPKFVSTSGISNPITLTHPFTFREALIRESGLHQYHVSNPLHLSEELRTDRWSVLCSYLMNYCELKPDTQLNIIYLLSHLCLHESVLEYTPVFSNSDLSNNLKWSKLAYVRAFSDLMLQPDLGTLDNLYEFERIANHTPSDSKFKLSVILQIISFSTKVFSDLSRAKAWKALADEELYNLKKSSNNFVYKLQKSIYYRAIVLVSILENDKEKTIREMDCCEFLAKDLINEFEDEIEEIAARENLRTVLESRTKEAIWLKDMDLAEERARRLVVLEPLYSRFRLQLGEVLINQRKFEEAARIYRSAARLGPPGTPIAWYMAGQCHEKLGDLDIACDCYLASVRMDDLAISSVERIRHLAPQLGDSLLTNWSQMRLQQLQAQQTKITEQPQTSYLSAASSELRLLAER